MFLCNCFDSVNHCVLLFHPLFPFPFLFSPISSKHDSVVFSFYSLHVSETHISWKLSCTVFHLNFYVFHLLHHALHIFLLDLIIPAAYFAVSWKKTDHYIQFAYKDYMWMLTTNPYKDVQQQKMLSLSLSAVAKTPL